MAWPGDCACRPAGGASTRGRRPGCDPATAPTLNGRPMGALDAIVTRSVRRREHRAGRWRGHRSDGWTCSFHVKRDRIVPARRSRRTCPSLRAPPPLNRDRRSCGTRALPKPRASTVRTRARPSPTGGRAHLSVAGRGTVLGGRDPASRPVSCGGGPAALVHGQHAPEPDAHTDAAGRRHAGRSDDGHGRATGPRQTRCNPRIASLR